MAPCVPRRGCHPATISLQCLSILNINEKDVASPPASANVQALTLSSTQGLQRSRLSRWLKFTSASVSTVYLNQCPCDFNHKIARELKTMQIPHLASIVSDLVALEMCIHNTCLNIFDETLREYYSCLENCFPIDRRVILLNLPNLNTVLTHIKVAEIESCVPFTQIPIRSVLHSIVWCANHKMHVGTTLPPGVSCILEGCGVYGISSHQHKPCHSQDMELSFTPEKTDTPEKLTLTTPDLSAYWNLSYETVALMELWLCHSTWCLWDNSSFLLLLEHAGHCGVVARRAAMALMGRFHFLRWAPGLDYAAVFKLKSARGCRAAAPAPPPSAWWCQIFPASRPACLASALPCASLNGAFCDLLPIFLLDSLSSYCWVWVSLWTKVLCWVSLL